MINIYKLELTILQQEIMRLLFIKAGKELNQRRIAETLNVSQPAVIKAIPKLVKDDLIMANKDKRWAISLNRDNKRAIQLKRTDNLKQIYESGLADHLYDALPGATIILFGSYAYGEDTIESDIDVAVFGIRNKDLKLNKFEKMLEREITLNYYKSFKGMKKNLLNNILNGIVIKGAVDL